MMSKSITAHLCFQADNEKIIISSMMPPLDCSAWNVLKTAILFSSMIVYPYLYISFFPPLQKKPLFFANCLDKRICRIILNGIEWYRVRV